MKDEGILQEYTLGDFMEKYEPIIKDVAILISVPFESTMIGLEEQISILCSMMERVSWCLACAKEMLINAEHASFPSKDKGRTEMERKLAVEYSVSKEQRLVEYLELINRNIEKYLSNAQSVLATKRMELDKFGYGKKEA